MFPKIVVVMDHFIHTADMKVMAMTVDSIFAVTSFWVTGCIY